MAFNHPNWWPHPHFDNIMGVIMVKYYKFLGSNAENIVSWMSNVLLMN